MVVAGGHASPDGLASDASPVTDGAAWDAATNTWHAIAPMPTTLPGYDPTAVWTGTEVLVWSSAPATPDTNGREVVLAYNPSTNTWRTLPSSGLTPRQGAVTIWTGHQLVVWGGLNFDFTYAYPDGARLDPLTGTWQRLPAAPVPARGFAGAAWSGRDVLLWGGQTGTSVRPELGWLAIGGSRCGVRPRDEPMARSAALATSSQVRPVSGVDGALLHRHRWVCQRGPAHSGSRGRRLRPSNQHLDDVASRALLSSARSEWANGTRRPTRRCFRRLDRNGCRARRRRRLRRPGSTIRRNTLDAGWLRRW